jgi:hypothetical protein
MNIAEGGAQYAATGITAQNKAKAPAIARTLHLWKCLGSAQQNASCKTRKSIQIGGVCTVKSSRLTSTRPANKRKRLQLCQTPSLRQEHNIHCNSVDLLLSSATAITPANHHLLYHSSVFYLKRGEKHYGKNCSGLMRAKWRSESNIQ